MKRRCSSETEDMSSTNSFIVRKRTTFGKNNFISRFLNLYNTFALKQYMCAADPDTMLRIEYGDYMQLPPEEERVWKHHPILIDFEHNYEELMQG